MLFSLTSSAQALLAASASVFSDGLGDLPVPSGNPIVAPQNPSTLVLALIGAGTIAIYFAARWRPARPDVARWTGRLSDQSERAEAIDAEQSQSRGAA